jgi:hypothetical protein
VWFARMRKRSSPLHATQSAINLWTTSASLERPRGENSLRLVAGGEVILPPHLQQEQAQAGPSVSRDFPERFDQPKGHQNATVGLKPYRSSLGCFRTRGGWEASSGLAPGPPRSSAVGC